VVHLHNHFCTGNTTATFHTCWWVTCHCQLYKNNKFCTTMLLWQMYVAGSNKMYLGLNVKCLTFLSFFFLKQIFFFFPTDFRKCAQYQSSQKSIQWESHWYVWTDGQTWQICICFLLCMWMCLKNSNTESSSHNFPVTNLPPEQQNYAHHTYQCWKEIIFQLIHTLFT